MYELIITNTAKEQLKNVPNNIKENIGRALERIKIRPFKFVKRLTNSKYYRLRVGFYRVILDIHTSALIIYVIELGHRSDIYK
ncbi:MAG: type II toxin-antitoxin system RelE/ParE family toxin [Nanoarchaeota archaeon]|nr:type II toxin-antitoxin system RelE/ParE family toxin [Nanoarchaeota archaeon]